MDYIRLWTDLRSHPKWIALSPRAKAVLIESFMWAGEYETDGHLPDATRKVIGATAAVVRELEANAWWHRNGSGWLINDWSDHQRTKAEMEEARAKVRSRVERHRSRKGGHGV